MCEARISGRADSRTPAYHTSSGETTRHALAGHDVDEAPRERESRIGGGQRGRHVLVRERDGHGEPRRVPRPERLQLVEKKAVARGADAEEDVPVPGGEVSLPAGEREDRHHAGDPASPRDAEDVPRHRGMERPVAERREDAEAGAPSPPPHQPPPPPSTPPPPP